MKKIIDGRKYDTATAREVGDWQNMDDVSDLRFICETLYRKKTGEYFLHGEGGAMTPYAEALGNNEWCGGETIAPMTYEAAREWAKERLGADEFESEFGEVAESDGTATITLSVSAGARSKLQRMSSQTGKTQSAIVEGLIEGA